MILNDAAQSCSGARCAMCIFRILVAIIPQQQCICIIVCVDSTCFRNCKFWGGLGFVKLWIKTTYKKIHHLFSTVG